MVFGKRTNSNWKNKKLENWNMVDYKKYVIDNDLNEIWLNYCNSKKDSSVKLVAYAPNYHYQATENNWVRITCDRCGNYARVKLDKSKACKDYQCKKCNMIKGILFRKLSSKKNSDKIYFGNSDIVTKISSYMRTMYFTLMNFDEKIIKSDSLYVDDTLWKSVTLGIDVDIKNMSDNITDLEVRKSIDVAKDIITDELNTFIPNGYTIMSSGNGLYFLINNNLTIGLNISNVMTGFNKLIVLLDSKIKEKTNNVKLDGLNHPSSVFKGIGSIHLNRPFIAVPIDSDIKLVNYNSSYFTLKNLMCNNKVDFNSFLDEYNSYKICEQKGLIDRLNSSDLDNIEGYTDEQILTKIEVTTGEKQRMLNKFSKLKGNKSQRWNFQRGSNYSSDKRTYEAKGSDNIIGKVTNEEADEIKRKLLKMAGR